MKYPPYIIMLLMVLNTFMLKAQSGLNMAEDFLVKDVNGQTHTLNTYLEQGKIVVLPFFTTTCGSCNIYTPEIVLSHQDFGCNQNNVIYLGINYGSNNIGVSDFISVHAVGYPCASGAEGLGNQINEQYLIASHITALVITPDGEIAGEFYGPDAYPTRDSLNSLLLHLGANMQDCSVGIDDLENSISIFEIAPNPIKDKTKLTIKAKNQGQYQIEIKDIAGHRLDYFPIYLDSQKNNIELNLEAYSKGLYFIQIWGNGQIISSEKILKI